MNYTCKIAVYGQNFDYNNIQIPLVRVMRYLQLTDPNSDQADCVSFLLNCSGRLRPDYQ